LHGACWKTVPTELREPKPDWHDVPAALRAKIEAIIGEPVVAGEKVFGGFGPMATFALTTASGARHFCKGSHPGNTKQGHAAVLREIENLRVFPELKRFGAAFRDVASQGDWHLMVLDHVPRVADVPPWTTSAVGQVMTAIAGFHRATPERAETILHDRWASDLIAKAQNWHTLRDKPDVRNGFVGLFEDREAASRWLDAHLAQFIALKERGPDIGGPQGWAHMDIRSDNLIFAEGRVLLVDWPVLSYGPQLLDIGFFLPSLAGEGGPSCAEGLRLYERATNIVFEPVDIAAAAAIIAGFFAARAGEPEEAALPRLRWIQKLQLFPSLDWLSDVLGVERPPLPKPFQA
jgi:hypothetical protein